MAIKLVSALSILGAASALNVYEPSGTPFPASGELHLRWDATSSKGETFSVYLMNGPDANGQRIDDPIAVGVKVSDGEITVHAGRNECGDCFLQFAVDGLGPEFWGYAARFTGNELVPEPEHTEGTTTTEMVEVEEESEDGMSSEHVEMTTEMETTTVEHVETQTETTLVHVETETTVASETHAPEPTSTSIIPHEPTYSSAMSHTPAPTHIATPIHTPVHNSTNTHPTSDCPPSPTPAVGHPAPTPSIPSDSESNSAEPERKDGDFFSNFDVSSGTSRSSEVVLVGAIIAAIASIFF